MAVEILQIEEAPGFSGSGEREPNGIPAMEEGNEQGEKAIYTPGSHSRSRPGSTWASNRDTVQVSPSTHRVTGRAYVT